MNSRSLDRYNRVVVMIIKTPALEFDDRLRKEIVTCRQMGFDVSVRCVLDTNSSTSGFTWLRSPFRSYRLWSRRILPSHSFVWLHVLEFAMRLLLSNGGLFSRPDRACVQRVIWLHDPVLLPVVPLAALSRVCRRCTSIVWDQHELPPESWIRHTIARKILKWAMALPDHLVCANAARVDYLKGKGIIYPQQRTLVVNNYADIEYATQPVVRLENDLLSWLDDEPYLLLQGGGSVLRNVESVLAAILSNEWPNVKVVIVGGYDKKLFEQAYQKNPKRFDQLIWLQGMVPQMDLARFADHAIGSLILYRASSPNQVYCEPNRLYQALCRGTPVIVGNNPPMVEVVSATGAGLILDDDGSNPLGIIKAVQKLLTTPVYKAAAIRSSKMFQWQTQELNLAKALTDRQLNCVGD